MAEGIVRIGPPGKRAALRDRPDAVYPFVLRLRNGATLADILPDHADDPALTMLPIIGGAALPLKVATAMALEGDHRLRQIWYLHPDLAPFLLRVMSGLDWSLRTLPLPAIANLSIAPPPHFWADPQHPEAPVFAALEAAAEAGLIPVVAIGNTGSGPGHRRGLVNPLSLSAFVISVGAWDSAAGAIAPFSSRGHPDRPETWPDLVAQGVDVIGPFPQDQVKSPERRARDEGNALFMSTVPAADRDLYTVESGTSQAAALVSGAAGQVLHFLRETIARTGDRFGAPLFEMTAPPGRVNRSPGARPRLTGTARDLPDGSTVFRYTVDLPWKMVAQVLRDAALPLPGVSPQDGGAGLIDRATINAQFGAHGIPPTKIAAVKVIE
jgi:subtilisin family serine protease